VKHLFLTSIFVISSLVNITSAHSNNDSWFTMGFALHSLKSGSSDAASPFGGGINMGWQVRARFFRFIHVEFDYNTTRVTGQGTDEVNSPDSLVREPSKSLTLALDLAHTVMGTPYILGGVGRGESTSDFDGNVYYAGIGLEIPFSNNWAFSAEARFLGPSLSDVKAYINRETEKKSINPSEIPAVTDFYNSSNYQVMVALRYYF
jgi:hypothetical protein